MQRINIFIQHAHKCLTMILIKRSPRTKLSFFPASLESFHMLPGTTLGTLDLLELSL